MGLTTETDNYLKYDIKYDGKSFCLGPYQSLKTKITFTNDEQFTITEKLTIYNKKLLFLKYI